MIEFIKEEYDPKESCYQFTENLLAYHIAHLSNHDFLNQPENIILKNRIASIGKDIQDVLQDIKNLP